MDNHEVMKRLIHIVRFLELSEVYDGKTKDNGMSLPHA